MGPSFDVTNLHILTHVFFKIKAKNRNYPLKWSVLHTVDFDGKCCYYSGLLIAFYIHQISNDTVYVKCMSSDLQLLYKLPAYTEMTEGKLKYTASLPKFVIAISFNRTETHIFVQLG